MSIVRGVVCTRGANRGGRHGRGAGGNLGNRTLLSADAGNIRGSFQIHTLQF